MIIVLEQTDLDQGGSYSPVGQARIMSGNVGVENWLLVESFEPLI